MEFVEDEEEMGPLAALGFNEDFFNYDDPPFIAENLMGGPENILIPPQAVWPPLLPFPHHVADFGPLDALGMNDEIFAPEANPPVPHYAPVDGVGGVLGNVPAEDVDPDDFVGNLLIDPHDDGEDAHAEPIVIDHPEDPIVAPASPIHGNLEDVIYEDDDEEENDDEGVMPEAPAIDNEDLEGVNNPGDEAEAAAAPPPANDPQHGEIEFEGEDPFYDLQPLIDNFFMLDD